MSRSLTWVKRNIEPIGIDLGSRYVRMVQMARHRGQVSIVTYAQREIPPGEYSPTELQKYQAQAIQNMLDEEKFNGRKVITALGWDQLQIRNLRIPTMPEEEVGQVVRYEAGDRFGLNPEEAQIRFMIAGDVRQGTEIRQEVIAMGISPSAIEGHIRMLQEMDLEPVAVDAPPCAMFRSFERFLRRDEDANQVNAYVDMGYTASRVVMSRGPELTFVKPIPIGGKRFDELLSEQLELSAADGIQMRERIRRFHVATLTNQLDRIPEEEKVNDNMLRAALDALRPALEQLGKEIALCLRYCQVTFRGPRTNEVIVLGGEACNTDMLQFLSDQVGIPFNIGRPMKNIPMEVDYGGADRRTGQPEWATVLGLALKPPTPINAMAS